MVFSTIIFLLRFLPITLALYYLAPPKLKNTVLFLCSLVFYCWGEVRFFPVMLALILINYLCGLGLERFGQNKTARLILLLIALAGSLGMLFYFKYANFVLSSINAIFGTGFAPIQGISVLPLGISFYTFQTLSYTIDVYRRDVKTEHNIIDFGAYVVMFPQLIAGPIVKYRDVSDRLHVYKGRYELKQIEDGMTLFTFGLAKKSCWPTPSVRSGRTSSAWRTAPPSPSWASPTLPPRWSGWASSPTRSSSISTFPATP